MAHACHMSVPAIGRCLPLSDAHYQIASLNIGIWYRRPQISCGFLISIPFAWPFKWLRCQYSSPFKHLCKSRTSELNQPW